LQFFHFSLSFYRILFFVTICALLFTPRTISIQIETYKCYAVEYTKHVIGMRLKGIGIVFIDYALRDASVIFSEDFPRTFYALTTLYRLGGRATPARIKAFLKNENIMSYRTFLKAIDDLQVYNIVTKEYGEYKIKEEYLKTIGYLIEEIPAKVAEILEKAFNEKISFENASLQVGSVLEELSSLGSEILEKYSKNTSIAILEHLYVLALYIVDKAKRTLEIAKRRRDELERILATKEILAPVYREKRGRGSWFPTK